LVQVSASHHENSLVIEISDDGGGIDTARLRRKAVESGLLSQTAADQLPEADALGLIFTSGLSTAAQVSEVSGRGVGMDIVRSNVQRLGGMIDVETQIGKGSTFRLRLPLTLAIIRGLLVKVDGNVFVLPLSTVIETTRIHKSEIKRRHKSEVLVVRERTTPLIRMNRAYPVNGVKVQNSADQYYVVIVGFANQRAGLIVDELIGEQEVVIKPLGKVCGQVPGLSGATILGDGKVALICDMNGLLNGNKK
jgi:two-component system chemotaxis sensor kinase CheA